MVKHHADNNLNQLCLHTCDQRTNSTADFNVKFYTKCKKEVKFTLRSSMKFQRGRGGIAFFNHSARWWGGGSMV
jgi:hypothetical protein